MVALYTYVWLRKCPVSNTWKRDKSVNVPEGSSMGKSFGSKHKSRTSPRISFCSGGMELISGKQSKQIPLFSWNLSSGNPGSPVPIHSIAAVSVGIILCYRGQWTSQLWNLLLPSLWQLPLELILFPKCLISFSAATRKLPNAGYLLPLLWAFPTESAKIWKLIYVFVKHFPCVSIGKK